MTVAALEDITLRNVHDVNAVMARALRPPPHVTVSEWSDAHRVLSPEENESGPWVTDRVPYMREIMNRLSSHDLVEQVVFQKPHQVGATEGGNNWVGYIIDNDPGRILMVQPTLDAAKRHSKSRITPLINYTPVLRELIFPARKRDSGNTLFAKQFPGGILMITGANSAVGLSSTPVRYLFADEIDRYPIDVDEQGDPFNLALRRTTTYRNKRKIYVPSTPTILGESKIDTLYEESDRASYRVPCLACGCPQEMVWAQVKWPKNEPWNARYECINCQVLWEEWQKMDMVRGGKWVAERERMSWMAAGYQMNALPSPWVTVQETAVEFWKSRHDHVLMKDWTNLYMGEAYEEKASIPIVDGSMMARCELYDGETPSGVIIPTAGVDIQGDRIEVLVVGWGKHEEAWHIAHEIIWGDPSGPAPWAELDDFLQLEFLDIYGRPFRIEATAVDSGYLNSDVYNFVRPRKRRRVWAIRGRDGQHPVWPKEPSRNNSGKVDVYLIGSDAIKETLYSRLQYPPPGPGRLHFPAHCSKDYFDQLLSEKRKALRSRGKVVYRWVKDSGKRNEIWDLWCYAYAALHGLLTMGFHPNTVPAGSGEGGRVAATVPQTGIGKKGAELETVPRAEPAPQPVPVETVAEEVGLPRAAAPPRPTRRRVPRMRPRSRTLW